MRRLYACVENNPSARAPEELRAGEDRAQVRLLYSLFRCVATNGLANLFCFRGAMVRSPRSRPGRQLQGGCFRPNILISPLTARDSYDR